MTTSPVCLTCGTEIRVDAKFCTSCGIPVATQEPTSRIDVSSSIPRCSYCGGGLVQDSISCPECGASTGVAVVPEKSTPNEGTRSEKGSQLPPLRLLQSWKLTVVMALVLVATVVGLKLSHTSDGPTTLSPKAMETVKEVESLQAMVERDPRNPDALLRLANLYYDIKIFARAVTMYDRYLTLQPKNSDARVDMGISYFQMAIEDSGNRNHYFDVAIDELRKALEHAPQHQLAYYNLGMIYLHRGDMPASAAAFQKCIAIDAGSSIGKRAKELIHEHSTNNPS